MAIYNRTNSTATATAATVPSMDLGSIIVTSLQNAVESMQNEDKDTTLKDTIRQGIEDSVVIKAIQASSSKLSNLFGSKSNTEAKKTKETPADKVMSTGLEKLLKANTDAKKDKETPAEKMEKEMSELLQITKDDKKKQKSNESKAAQEKKKEKEHKTTIKEGFSAVKTFGATIMNKIGLIILGVAVIAELFVFLKYTYHYLMGVWIPNTWTKIKLAWTGFWTKITTEIRNFFVGLFRPIFTKFGIELGLSEEQIKRKAELAKEITDSGGGNKLKTLADTRKTATQSLNEIESRLKGSDYEYLLTYLNADELREKISKGENITQDINKWQTQWLSGAISGARSKGDSGNVDRLQSIDSSLTGMLNNNDFKSVADAYKDMKDFLDDYPEMASVFEEYKALEKGLVDVDAAVRNAQVKLMEEEYNEGNLSVMESETLKADKKYGDIVKEAYKNVGGDTFNKYEQDDKHETWLKTYGKEWVDTFRDMTNHLTQNIGVNVSIPENTYPFGVKMD